MLKLFKKIKNSPFFDNNKSLYEKNLNKRDHEYIGSLSSAIMQIQPQKLHYLILIFTIVIFTFILWANFTKIDEIARGQGTVIPSGQNQIVQNLEGGIVSFIYVNEGDFIKKGDLLLQINNSKSLSLQNASNAKEKALKAKIERLQVQLNEEEFAIESHDKDMILFLENEKKLFDANLESFKSQIRVLEDKLSQKKSELADAKQRKRHLSNSLSMINEEVKMTEPMVQRGVKSKVEFLQLKREQSNAQLEYNSSLHAINRLDSEVDELLNSLEQTKKEFESRTRVELNDAIGQLKELQANLEGLSDQLDRTKVLAPLSGIVKKLFVNTIGGAVKPAQDLVEIVPTEEKLLVEVKIKPSDIAFIYKGQNSIVKFSAYDFAIYGGLNAKVVNISPDTITEEKETYYLVTVETNKNYISRNEKKLKIIPGMIADVDILTGKKSILDYILKPILKTTQYTFTER